MTVGQARDAARQWVMGEAGRIPGFGGAYTAGSTNWLPEEAEVAAASDLDIMVAVTDPDRASRRGKLRFREVLLDVSYLRDDQLRSPELVLSDYHLAPSFWTANILADPSGHLKALREAVGRDYAKRWWVRQRCANARDKVRGHLRPIRRQAPLHDLVTACLFGAGVTTHVLLTAGLRNPTVRSRYAAVRGLLADYDQLGFHEAMLELLGAARMSRGRIERHLATLAEIFDATKKDIQPPFPFASDLSDAARPIAIDGSRELIERGYHRESMFWIAVTHSRCQKALAGGTVPQRFRDSYRELAGDLGIASFADARRRGAEIERFLPRVWEVAETIMAADGRIEDD